MRQYQPRRIEFAQIAETNGWAVKVYTISSKQSFTAHGALRSAIEQLPTWLQEAPALGFETYGMAFLIVHEGEDGIWSLINWWLGGEMLQSNTYYSSYENVQMFTRTPREGFMACVWEMSVIDHERKRWIEHILKSPDAPQFESYLQARLSGTM